MGRTENCSWMWAAKAGLTLVELTCLKIDQQVESGWGLGDMDI